MGVQDDRMLTHRHQAAPAVKFSTLMLNICRIFILRVHKYEDGIAHEGMMAGGVSADPQAGF
jgi:hypothetical protein